MGFWGFGDAAVAGGHQIGPGGFAPFRSRDDVVDSQLLSAAAILALASVPPKQIGPVEQHAFVRNVFVMRQTDDRWISKAPRYSSDF